MAKAVEDAKPALQQAATEATKTATTAANDLAQQLLSTAQTKSDTLLQDLSKDVQTSITQLGSKLAGDTTLKGYLDNAVQSVVKGQDIQALDYYNKLVQSKLTDDQMAVVKQTGDVLSAFVVQKNFGALDGMQSEVAQIVNSLRKGDTTTAIPAIQKVASSAKLTDSQKELIGSLADKYAPGVKAATKSLQDGLQKLKF